MSKLLYGIGILAILSSGVPFALCGMQWRQNQPDDGIAPAPSLAEKAHLHGRLDADRNRDAASPLVAQATAFALYLNPPKPPAQVARPAASPAPAPRPVTLAPRFRLLSTSCYPSSPERSLALVAEPGKGGYWVMKGDRLGHLVVESIKDGGIVCRDGNRLQEIAVTMKDTAPLAQLKSDVSAAIRSAGPQIRSPNTSLLDTRKAEMPDVQPGMEGGG